MVFKMINLNTETKNENKPTIDLNNLGLIHNAWVRTANVKLVKGSKRKLC